MRGTKFALLTVLLPMVAMADGPASGQDRFSDCNVPGGDPNEIHDCYFTVGDEVEREMVDAYRLAQAALTAFDLEHSLNDDRSTSKLLQETQIAFEEYRKRYCQFPEREALGGTGSINGTITCRVDLTLLRIRQLAEHAELN